MPLSNLRALTNKQKCFLNRGEKIYNTHVNIIRALVGKDAELAKAYLHHNIIVPLEEEIVSTSNDIERID